MPAAVHLDQWAVYQRVVVLDATFWSLAAGVPAGTGVQMIWMG